MPVKKSIGHNRYLHALSFYPDVHFESKLPDEKVVLILRAHPITQVSWIFNTFILLLFLFVGNFIMLYFIDLIRTLFLDLVMLVIILFTLMSKNSKLSTENKKLTEIIEVKDVTIANYEASRVAVSDVIENFSSLDDVMVLINAGESKAEVSEKLNIPLSKIELIIKFDKLKKKN